MLFKIVCVRNVLSFPLCIKWRICEIPLSLGSLMRCFFNASDMGSGRCQYYLYRIPQHTPSSLSWRLYELGI